MFKWLTKAVGMSYVPSFALTDAWAGRIFAAGAQSYSGKSVTVDSSLNLSTVWACVRLIARTISTLPIQTFYVDDKGDRSPALDHPLYALLHDYPNADMVAADYWEAVVSHLLLWGNSVSEIQRIGGRPVALYPLRPDRISLQRRPDGTPFYRYQDLRQTREIEVDDALHIKGFSFDGLWGLSPVGAARHSLGTALSADEMAGSIFKNGMRPAGTLSTEQVLDAAARSRLKVRMAEFTGAGNTGKTLLLDQGLTWAPVTLPPEEAQLLQTREFNVEEICRWFDVPPWMVGHTERGQGAGKGLEQQMIAFLTFSLRPWLTKIEQTLQQRLVPTGQRGRLAMAFDVSELMRTDAAGRAELYSSYTQNGIKTRNEIRKSENLPAIEGADELTAQVNLAPLNKLGMTVSQGATDPVKLPGGGDPPIRQ